MMRDALPTNVLLQSYKVFANNADVTSNFEYNNMVYDEDPDNVTNTVVISAKPEYLETEVPYGKTYDFRFTVKISSLVQKPSEFINRAVFSIHYKDSEPEQNVYHMEILDQTSDGDPSTRTTNTVKTTFEPKIPFKKVWAEEDGYYDERPTSITLHLVGSDGSHLEKVLTGGAQADEWEYVFTNIPGYTGTGDKITYTLYEDEVDMYDCSNLEQNPLTVKFNEENVITNALMLGFPTQKNVYNTNNVDIDTQVVVHNDTLHYVLTVTNPSSVSKKFDFEDVIPENSTYVANSASNSGVYDTATKKITWTDVVVAGKASGTVSFDVKAVAKETDWATIINSANVWMKRANTQRNLRTATTTNEVTNFVPPEHVSPTNRKTVTDASGRNIENLYVEKDKLLYYHIPVTNGTTMTKTFIVTDAIPANTTYVSAGQDGVYANNKVTWTSEIASGATKTFDFVVKVTSDNCEIENTANVATDLSNWDTNTVYNQAPLRLLLIK